MTEIITCPVARPYSKKKGGPPSVTTILSAAIGKPALAWAAANETASFALNHRDEYADLSGEEAWDRLRKHHRIKWDRRAAIGSTVHGVNSRWALDLDADVEAIAREVCSNAKGECNEERLAGVLDEIEPYIDGLEQFWADWQPETLATEFVVAHGHSPHDYIGQADWLARLADGRLWLLDLKTTGKAESEGYPEEWALQLAAYRYAETVVLYDESGNETARKPREVLLPEVEAAGVVHLRGEGYRFLEIRAGREQHSTFTFCRALYEWLNRRSKDPGTCVPVVAPGGLEAALEQSIAAAQATAAAKQAVG
jgi:hypothetical protein